METTPPLEPNDWVPKPGIWHWWMDVLTRPGVSLPSLAGRREWIGAAWLILLGLLVRWWPEYLVIGRDSAAMFRTTMGFPGDAAWVERLLSGSIAALAVYSMVPLTLVISWFLRAGLLYGVGKLVARGRGKGFWYLFTGVGWAWAPLLIQNVLLGCVAIVAPHLVVSQGETLEAAELVRYLVFEHLTPLVWWNWILSVLVVSSTFEIPRRRALLVVAVAVILNIANNAVLYGALYLNDRNQPRQAGMAATTTINPSLDPRR